MNRRDFLKNISLGAAAMVLPGCAWVLGKPSATGKSGRKPNFVLILVDDLGWMDIGCYGSTFYETPNIDRLASEGMRFIDGYAACAVCSPTRAAVMTGRYPARVGVTDWIHCMDFKGSRTDAKQKGPAEYVGGKKNKLLCPPNPFWMELDEVTIAEVLKPAGYTCCHIGKWHLGPDAWYPDEQGFDLNIGGCDYGQPPSYFDPYHKNEKRPDIPTLKGHRKGEYLTDRESDEAVNFIRRHKDKPFFLYIPFNAVHGPINRVPRYTDRYTAREAALKCLDDAIGRIVAALEKHGFADNTLLVFTNDNGGLTEKMNKPYRGTKNTTFEGGVRVPCIIRWPGRTKPGTVNNGMMFIADFFTTFITIAGGRHEQKLPVDSLDMTGMLFRGESSPRDEIVFEVSGSFRIPTIRKGDYKLMGKLLYNIKTDPYETTDIATQHPDIVKRLRARLLEVDAERPPLGDKPLLMEPPLPYVYGIEENANPPEWLKEAVDRIRATQPKEWAPGETPWPQAPKAPVGSP